MLPLLGLTACSLWPGGGGDGEKRTVRDEKITVSKVFISKERTQCEDGSGKELSATKDELQAADVKVFSSECGVLTGVVAPALCGSTTLHINIHGIDKRKFPEAEALGFKPVTSLEGDLGYEIILCEEGM